MCIHFLFNFFCQNAKLTNETEFLVILAQTNIMLCNEIQRGIFEVYSFVRAAKISWVFLFMSQKSNVPPPVKPV